MVAGYRKRVAPRRLSLLAGCSLGALLSAGAALCPLSASAKTPLFSNGWVSQTAAANSSNAASGTTQPNAAVGGVNGQILGLSQIQAKASQQVADLTAAAQAVTSTQAAQLAAQKAAQAAAAATAAAGLAPVTDGLSANGLMVDSRIAGNFGGGCTTSACLWANANAPVQSTGNGTTTVTITQTAARAVMTWSKFNVGAHTVVDFDQSGGNSGTNGNSWVALNRIDASGSPSQILGSIKADGTVLLINPNGVIFGAGSQVNVHSLIASAMDLGSYSGASNIGAFSKAGAYLSIGDGLYAPDLESGANYNFVNSGLFANNGGAAVFATGNLPSGQTDSGILVQSGASITAAVSGTANGGLIALLGPSVANAGGITATNGQIIMAGASAMILTEPVSGAVASGSAPLATSYTLSDLGSHSLVYPTGTTVYGAVQNQAGGLLLSQDGNITLYGGDITQAGVVAASSSVNRSGSILIDSVSGSATFGAQSVTALLPDGTSSATLAESAVSSFVPPTMIVETYGDIDIKGGALIEAPGANLTLTGLNAGTGTLLLESGATIDLAGLTNVSVPVSDLMVSILVTANDVADDPLAQSLIGQTVTIDARLGGTTSDGRAWVGSPILDASGYVGDISETVQEILTRGGTLQASGWRNVVTAPSSTVNVSAGWITVQDGTIKTTSLVGADGSITDIGSASTGVLYTGIAGSTSIDHAAWGVTTTYENPLLAHAAGFYQEGYIDGASTGNLVVNGVSKGAISISAINPVLEGDIVALTEAGTRQRTLAETGTQTVGLQIGSDSLPTGAALSIALTPDIGGLPNSVVLQNTADVSGISGLNFSSAAADDTSLKVTGALVYSTAALSADGLGAISVTGAYSLSMAAGNSLSVQPGGSIKLADVTTIDGTLSAPGGSITLQGYDGSDAGRGVLSVPAKAVVVGPDAVLTVAGLWVNDTGLAPDAIQGAAFVNGGTVSIQTTPLSVTTGVDLGNGTAQLTSTDATQSIVLSAGSVIDLSSGGYVTTAGKLKIGSDGLPVGNGGNLSLTTYAGTWSNTGSGILGIASIANGVVLSNWEETANLSPTGAAGNATVYLDGTILSEGFNKGGTFSLQVPAVQIGGGGITGPLSDAGNGEVFLPASFFTNAGFSNYALTSTYGSVTVASGTTLVLQQSNFLPFGSAGSTLSAGSGAAEKLQPTGSSVGSFEAVGIEPDGLRQPVSLTLAENTLDPYAPVTDSVATRAGVVVESGASIVADPLASISLTSTGGSVTMLGAITAPGGSIDLEVAAQAAQVGTTESGSVLPVDLWIGADAVLNVAGTFVPNPTVTAYQTGTVLAGGTITLETTTIGGGINPIVVKAGAQFDIQGATGIVQTPGATPSSFSETPIWSDGGTLSISTGTLYFDGSVGAAPVAPAAAGGTLSVTGLTDIIVGQSGITVPTGLTIPASERLLANLPNADFLTADLLGGSGFDSVTLSTVQDAGTIVFTGNVSINLPNQLVLNAGTLMLLPGGLTQTAAAGYAQSPSGTLPTSTAGATVNLSAGYLALYGQTGTANSSQPHLADGTLNIAATTQVDLGNLITVVDAAQVGITSGGDIRLVGANGIGGTGATPYGGALLVPSVLTMTAHQLYPETDTDFLIAAPDRLTIASNGASSAAPLSAGGAVLLDSTTIVQDGTVRAPLGTIEIGMPAGASLPDSIAALIGTGSFALPVTQSATLGTGSVTSVSAAGLEIPFGITVDGTTWYEGLANNGSGTASAAVLTSAPAKSVQLTGSAISVLSGATIDASGGGDIYATEFISGTGGTRNVLTATAPGQTVYALVPTYGGKVAPYDPTFAQTYGSAQPAIGEEVSISAGSGIPAGTYVLMPGMYATLPGAYKVVGIAGTSGALVSGNTTGADGSQYIAGTLINGITGTHAALQSVFEIQSNAVWNKYSDISITSGGAYFSALVSSGGASASALPADAGQIVIDAGASLTLKGTTALTPASGGRGGQIDIAAANILVLGSDQSESSADKAVGALVLDADQLSVLDATTLVLGGSMTLSGTDVLNPIASLVEVETDSAHPLAAPELIIATQGGGRGIVVDAGSVLTASASVPTGTDAAISVTGDGALLRLSQGQMVGVTRSGVTQSSGAISLGPQVTLAGGSGAAAALTLNSSGGISLGNSVSLTAENYAFAADQINVGGGSGGLTLASPILAQLAGAQSVSLTSASVFDFYGTVKLGTAASPIANLTLDGSGLYGTGGDVSIVAGNITLTDSQASPSAAGAVSGSGGALTVQAANGLTLGAGSQALSGFATAAFSGGQQILFSGSGGLQAGGAAVTLSASDIVVGKGASYSLVTTGDLSLASLSGTAPAVAASAVGGTLNLTAARMTDDTTLTALGGAVTFEATGGDVVLASGAKIVATGSAVPLFDETELVSGGVVKLISDQGNVTLSQGSVVDVSAAGAGYAGGVVIQTAAAIDPSVSAAAAAQATGATATLQGSLVGTSVSGDEGASLTVITGKLVGGLPSGFSGAVALSTRQGNIDIGDYSDAVASSLTAESVTLVANGGLVKVDGTIDASGSAGGTIALYGARGVTLDSTAKLLAEAKAVNAQDPTYDNAANLQAGGTIVLGTTGTPSSGVFNADGSEGVSAANSGAISVAAGAILDVSGGEQAGLSGGQVIVRAPIVTGGQVDVGFAGTVTGADSRGVTLDAYEVWSTADSTSGGQHFDGIIDPAGWYSASGSNIFASNGSLNQSHIAFYQTTLAGFVENPFSGNAAGVAADFTSVSGTQLHLSPEIDLVNPLSSVNNGSITVASNWNLGAGSGDGTASGTKLVYRTTGAIDPGEPGVLALRALNGVTLQASIGDGFFTPESSGYTTPADAIANNPGTDSAGKSVFNTTTSGDLMSASLSKGSFSYAFTAGADFTSAEPDVAVAPQALPALAAAAGTATAGDLIITGHTSFTDPTSVLSDANIASSPLTPIVNIPTVLRTGTGSITLTAADDVAFTDTVVSGAVYSAGAAVATPSGFTLTAATTAGNGLVSTPAWGDYGGAVKVTAGTDIIGVEATADMTGATTGLTGAMTGQLWSAWYEYATNPQGSTVAPFADGVQSVAWINYATFFQGFGALGGGNVSLTAGRNIRDVSASLPETLLVTGGLAAGDNEAEHFYGGGNLTVTAGGSLYSGDFYVGRGSGAITVGGSVTSDVTVALLNNFNTGGISNSGLQEAVPLLLAVQDGSISVTARGDITLGGVVDPTTLPLNLLYGTASTLADSAALGTAFDSFGAQSGVSLTSVAGTITFGTLDLKDAYTLYSLFEPNSSNFTNITNSSLFGLLPASLSLDAVSGDVNLDNGGTMIPAATGGLSVLAGGSINFTAFYMTDLGGALAGSPAFDTDFITMLDGTQAPLGALGQPAPTLLTQALHAGDTAPTVFYAGQDINNASTFDSLGNQVTQSYVVTLIKPARIEAGRDIIDLDLIGQNNQASDITSIIAGRDIASTLYVGKTVATDGDITLYGPGTLYLQAGRDLGPFSGATAGGATAQGLVAAGDGSDLLGINGLSVSDSGVIKTYLPGQAAQIVALFGVGNGIDYATAIKDYVNPASAGTGGINLLSLIAGMLGEGDSQAWTGFQGMSGPAQDILVDRAFLAFLGEVSTDYNVVGGTYYHQYDRAYRAVQTLFPASSGYTDDNISGTGGNGAIGGKVSTGHLNMAFSVIETQEPSNGIFLLGPGGGITVGSDAADTLKPLQEGILTLQGGAIEIFTDGTVAVQQSRIMTGQGGDIDIFSANGDILAGAAAKTVQSVPPETLICDLDGYCRVNPAGVISGGGIAALVTIAGQNPDDSNVILTAPVGTVDAGAAGIRAAGNVTINALHVLNAFNIQYGGTAVGIPSAPVVNVSALAAANASAAGANLAANALAGQKAAVIVPSIITVDILGFGEPDADQQRRLLQDQ